MRPLPRGLPLAGRLPLPEVRPQPRLPATAVYFVDDGTNTLALLH